MKPYRNRKSSTSVSIFRKVENLIKILQGIAIIVGIWATYFSYEKYQQDKIQSEKSSFEETRRMYKKEFYTLQMACYSEACEVVSILATEKVNSLQYNTAKSKFLRLYWGRLSMVEDKQVESQMVLINGILPKYEKGENLQDSLQSASLTLAHLSRRHLIMTWLDSDEVENYNN